MRGPVIAALLLAASPSMVLAEDWTSIADKTLIFEASGAYTLTRPTGEMTSGNESFDVHLYVAPKRLVLASFPRRTVDGQDTGGPPKPSETWDIAAGRNTIDLGQGDKIEVISFISGSTLTVHSRLTRANSLAAGATDTYTVTLAPACTLDAADFSTTEDATGRSQMQATLHANSCRIVDGQH